MSSQLNSVREIFKSIPFPKLEQAIREMREDDELGIIRGNGVIREITREVVKITNQPVSVNLFTTRVSILQEYAYRSVD